MPTFVETTQEFDKAIERLGRRFPAVVDSTEDLIGLIEKDQRPGVRVPGVGAVVYKARLANRSAGLGKRGGFRIIYYIRPPDEVYLLTIYSKTDKDNIRSAEIRRLVNSVP